METKRMAPKLENKLRFMNFGWVLRDELAGSQGPVRLHDLTFLHSQGVRAVRFCQLQAHPFDPVSPVWREPGIGIWATRAHRGDYSVAPPEERVDEVPTDEPVGTRH